jgi:hypothetical protein
MLDELIFFALGGFGWMDILVFLIHPTQLLALYHGVPLKCNRMVKSIKLILNLMCKDTCKIRI